MSADPRAEVLRQAAAAKRAGATARAEAGLRRLVKDGAPVNFRAVASAGGVSVDFLYRHGELRARIEHLRSRQPAKSAPTLHTPGSTGAADNVVAALTAKLRDAHREIAVLKAQLAVAHGELLTLRRQHPVSAVGR